MTDLDNDEIDIYYDVIGKPQVTKLEKVYRGRIPTRTNKHFISLGLNVTHKLEQADMFHECFEEIILKVNIMEFSELNFLKISSNNTTLLTFNTRNEIMLGLNCINFNDGVINILLPGFNVCDLKHALIIETNVLTKILIASQKMGNMEAKKKYSHQKEVFFEDVFFKEYTIDEDDCDSVKIEPNINCAVTEMKIFVINDNPISSNEHLSFKFSDLGFLKSNDSLYNRYFEFMNNKLGVDYFHLKADLSPDYLGANDKYIITPKHRKYIKVNGLNKYETIKILVMFKFVNILHETIKCLSPYV